MLVLRSVLFNLVFYVVLIVMMIVLLPTLAMGPPAVRWTARLWGRSSLILLRVICGTRVEFRGRENIPPGGLIVAAKHQSMWEVFALLMVFPDFSYVLKRELTYIPLFGWYLRGAHQIAINRAKGRAALSEVLRQARVQVAEGRVVFIFPEGTRRPAGAPPAYKIGVGVLYGQLGVPCVPVALNSGLFWARRSFLRRPGTIVIDVLPPIPPGLPTDKFMAEMEGRIETATASLNAEAVAKDPALAAILARNAAAA